MKSTKIFGNLWKTKKIYENRLIRWKSSEDKKPAWNRAKVSKPHFSLSPYPPKLWCFPYHFVHIPGTFGIEIGSKDHQNRAWKQYLGKSVIFCSGSVFGSFLDVLWAASSCQWNVVATKRSRFSFARGPGLARTLPFCQQSQAAGHPISQPSNHRFVEHRGGLGAAH